MSSWTYVHGTIVASPPGRTQHEKRYILETVLDHLPVVTGSERDMEVYVIQKEDIIVRAVVMNFSREQII